MEILNIEEIVVVSVKGLVMLKLVNNDLFRYLIIVLIIGNMYLRSIGFFFVYLMIFEYKGKLLLL